MQAGNWPEAEGFFLRAKQPEAALTMYRKASMWSEALRIAEDYVPNRVRKLFRTHCSGTQREALAGPQLESSSMIAYVLQSRTHKRTQLIRASQLHQIPQQTCRVVVTMMSHFVCCFAEQHPQYKYTEYTYMYTIAYYIYVYVYVYNMYMYIAGSTGIIAP